ncbi:MAG TPA: hypothetical protein VIX87_05205 [Steroidobacteraceae bacterium]
MVIVEPQAVRRLDDCEQPADIEQPPQRGQRLQPLRDCHVLQAGEQDDEVEVTGPEQLPCGHRVGLTQVRCLAMEGATITGDDERVHVHVDARDAGSLFGHGNGRGTRAATDLEDPEAVQRTHRVEPRDDDSPIIIATTDRLVFEVGLKHRL